MGSILCSEKNSKKIKTIRPEDVISPQDHGFFYAFENHNDQLEYLFSGEEIEADDISAIDLESICALPLVFVPYKSLVNGVHVIRAFSKELIPINFGYGMDFLDHPKIDRKQLKKHIYVHFFA